VSAEVAKEASGGETEEVSGGQGGAERELLGGLVEPAAEAETNGG
jgi:hypothetical protein